MKAFRFVVKFITTLTVGSAALAGSVALLAPAGSSYASAATPLGQLELQLNQPSATSFVYDHNGDLMGSFSKEDRQPVALKNVPQVMQDALLSIEDRKFYEHHGVDWGGTIRALFKNVDAGGISQGGSTITQQLVKNALSDPNRQRDLKTKGREAILAIRLEHELTKNQILEDYLNLVYFGNGAYGVQVATERYFDEPLNKLTLAQAALLAGLIQSPEALNPIQYPAAAARRRSEVLDAMVVNGKTTAAKAKAAKAEPLPRQLSYPNSGALNYYLDWVRRTLIEGDASNPNDPAKALGANKDIRSNELYRGGLKIYTAYDPTMQLQAEKAINDKRPPGRPDITASLVSIDNSDGGVRAIANAEPFLKAGQTDPAVEGFRQVGSTMKAFTLAAALSHGYSPNDQVRADPLSAPVATQGAWNPLHGDCKGGTPNLYTALARSDNCAFARIEMSLGPGDLGRDGVKQVIQEARAFGITSTEFKPFALSTTLGVGGISPLEMAQGYSVFPNDGVLKHATFVTKIVRGDGKVLYQNADPGRRVVDTNVARSEVDIMKGVVRSGTASSSLGRFPRPIAGKTGTTDGPSDIWFVGYTPQITTAVWVGHLHDNLPMKGLTAGAFGATYPAFIWNQYMLAATASMPPLDFPAPNKSLWPRAGFIDEKGRKLNFENIPTTPDTFTVTPGSVPAGPTTSFKSTPTTKGGPGTTVAGGGP